MERIPWEDYFMKQAFGVAERSTCLHHHVGAVIVKDKRIITTGYNSPASGEDHCFDLGYCLKEKIAEGSGKKVVSGKGLDDCPAIHAEQNAIYQAALLGISLKGASIYTTHQPCSICSRAISQVRINEVRYVFDYPDKKGLEILSRRGVKYSQLKIPKLEISFLR